MRVSEIRVNQIRVNQGLCFISQSDINTIMTARESFLFYKEKVYVKSEEWELFENAC